MARVIRQLVKNNHGVALIEFALLFPVMFLLLFGGIEVTRYILIIQKVEKAAYQITNLVAQYTPATYVDPAIQPPVSHASEISQASLIRDIVAPHVLDRIMSPYGRIADEGLIITSFVHATAGQQDQMRWQLQVMGENAIDLSKRITNTAPTTPYSHPVNGACPDALGNNTAGIQAILNGSVGGASAFNGENIIVAEIFFNYRPLVTSLFSITGVRFAEQTLSRRYLMYPRNGPLLNLPGTDDLTQVPSPATGGNNCSQTPPSVQPQPIP